MSFTGKNILVVGGSSGTGKAVIHLLASRNATIYNASRSRGDDWPEGVNHLTLDVMEDVTPLASYLPESLHGVVYCVGSINLKPFTRLSPEDFLRDYRLNVVGAASVIQQALKPLQNAGTGSVVLISTVAAKAGMSYHASIAAAKRGLEGLALSLAAELAPKQIRVNVIAPSLTDTPLAGSLLSTPEKREASAKRHPLGRFGTVNDLAQATAFLLSEDSSWITGQIIGIDGGLGSLRNL
ncbi:MAG: SDR family oxidoreductase [Chitinophagaceae bacterium]|nr:SDR family oxidoreductase [Chitinophagaceae bacterium]